MINKLKKELKENSNPKRIKQLQKFFKTGEGEYGEGQIFLGISTPKKRDIAKKYSELNLKELQQLLESKIHDEKFIALVILENRYKKARLKDKERLTNFYLYNTKNINNWDLVDISAYKILGEYLIDKKEKRKILYNLAGSKNLWERRISIISCFSFIRKKDFSDTINISEKLLKDDQDLIHKAVGWMLREIGNREKKFLWSFLEKNYRKMPRTMLRYSIEKFPENERKKWLKK